VVVGAVIRRRVGRIVRATEIVVVDAAAGKMSRSHAEVIPADAGDVTHAETTHVGSAEAAHVTSTKAAAKAATMSAAATAAGLCPCGNKAAGKQRSCQNHHPSSFHDLSPLGWAEIPPRDPRQMPVDLIEPRADIAIDWKMGVLVRRPH
jgi:hypothetical protein